MGLVKGADMIRYLMQHWGSTKGLGTHMHRSFELTQLDCGLEGNYLQDDYSVLGCLATQPSGIWMVLQYPD